MQTKLFALDLDDDRELSQSVRHYVGAQTELPRRYSGLGPRAYSTGLGIFWDTDFQSLDDAMNIVAKYKKYYRTNYIKAYLVGNREQREFILQASKALKSCPPMKAVAMKSSI